MERRRGDVSTICHRIRSLAGRDDADDAMAFDTQTLSTTDPLCRRVAHLAGRGNEAADIAVAIPDDFSLASGEPPSAPAAA